MDTSFIRETIYGMGKEAIAWAPIAIGLATDNPTVLAVGELSYAAFSLYTARNSTTKAGRLSALTNATLALAAPFTYHPLLAQQISTTAKACLSLGIGANSIARGGAEIVSAAQKAGSAVLAGYRKDDPRDNTAGSYGKMAGSALQLGLGIYRVYTGARVFQDGFSQLSVSPAQENENTLKWESDKSSSPKMNSKYAKEEIAPRFKQTPKQPKFNPRHAKEVLHERASPNPKQPQALCPPKSGQHHPNDVAFYAKVASYTSVTSVLPLNKFKEERCGGTLYLRSEDTNYMHAKDNYIRSEDTRPIGELPPQVSEKLIKEGRIWYRHVEKVKDICKHIDAIHQSGGRINRLIIVGHGNPKEMLLSQKGSDRDDLFKRFFSTSSFFQPGSDGNFQSWQDNSRRNLDDLFKFNFGGGGSGMDMYEINTATRFPKTGCLKNLGKNADIILISCSTGQQGSRNLAETIAAQVPGHNVIAPLSVLRLSDVRDRTLNNRVQLYFVDSKGEDATYIASTKKPK